MHKFSFLVVVTQFLVGLAVGLFTELIKRESASLDSWLATESPYALDGVLNNIGANGGKAQGASSGIVVASPNKNNPDCLLTPIPHSIYQFYLTNNRLLHLDSRRSPYGKMPNRHLHLDRR